MTELTYVCIIPTRNAGAGLAALLTGLKSQSLPPQKIIVIDSASTDGTAELARLHGAQTLSVQPASFRHGGTRQQALDWALAQGDFKAALFCTQDIHWAGEEACEKLLAAFSCQAVGAAYGRQLPRGGAALLERRGREFNYPDVSCLKSYADRKELGIKAAFCSNSFAAYRLTALRQIGGFPKEVILGEDMAAAASMLRSGWLVAYQAAAAVYHSHGYSLREEAQRAFDTGVFHAREAWLLQEFGKAEREGLRLVQADVRALWQQQERWRLLGVLFLRCAVRWLAYRLGRWEQFWPKSWKRSWSMHAAYWQ